jgi:hypothetical protein
VARIVNVVTKGFYNQKVFKGVSQRGKSTMDYFYGFIFYLIVNVMGIFYVFYNDNEKHLQTEHFRPRSFVKFLFDLGSAFITYFFPKILLSSKRKMFSDNWLYFRYLLISNSG